MGVSGSLGYLPRVCRQNHCRNKDWVILLSIQGLLVSVGLGDITLHTCWHISTNYLPYGTTQCFSNICQNTQRWLVPGSHLRLLTYTQSISLKYVHTPNRFRYSRRPHPCTYTHIYIYMYFYIYINIYVHISTLIMIVILLMLYIMQTPQKNLQND